MKQKRTAIVLILLAFFVYGAHAQYRINAGGGQVVNGVDTFYTDSYFTTNTSIYSTTTAIAGTSYPQIYQSERYSTSKTFSYALPVSPGLYKVVLHFAEIYLTAINKRVFDVSLDGNKVLDNYDIFKKVGGFTATTETFFINVADDTLNIYFSSLVADGGVDNPKISAIEVLLPASNPGTGSGLWSASGNNIFSGNTGNVGIGTSNPQAKLAVKGEILAEKVRVSIATNDWPDYVFEDGYRVAPLKEVEGFIRTNGHLPGVPAAAEVNEKGLDVGAGQAVLLKKIEELTLYLIAQEKRLEELERQLREKEKMKKKKGKRKS